MKTGITKLNKLSLMATLFGLCVVTIFAGIHGNSHAFGKTAAGWIEIYERWAFGELAIPIDENGNAVVDRHVVLMPIPNTPGYGTPGHLDVTLNARQAFVLPLGAELGSGDPDGNPPDRPPGVRGLQRLASTLQTAGLPVINQA